MEQKTQLFVPPTYRRYMWNMERISFTASEEKSFENVDGRMDDRGRMPAYTTISSPMNLGSGKLKKQRKFNIKPYGENFYQLTYWDKI